MWGNTIIWDAGQPGSKAVVNHEYVHVLQYRRDGVGFLGSYALQDVQLTVDNARRVSRGDAAIEKYKGGNAYETQAERVGVAYEPERSWFLPNLWNLP